MARLAMSTRNARAGGYTLVELMIVLVILGVLASWAIPQYFGYVREARRADAIGSLNRILAQQELFYSNNGSTYTAFVASLGYNTYGAADTALSEDGYYAIEMEACAAPNDDPQTCIQLEATPVAGRSQAKDLDCALIAINTMGRQTAEKSDSSANNTECWN